MNIGSTNFNNLPAAASQSALDGNPFFGGLTQALQRQALQLGNQKSKAQLPYAGPQAQANLMHQNLMNQYYGPLTQSTIDRNNSLAQWYKQGGGRSGVNGAALRDLSTQIATDHPDWTPAQVNDAGSAYLEGRGAFSDGTPLPAASGRTASILDRINKQNNTAQGLNQQRFAATLDTLFKQGDQIMPDAAQFAGAAGKTKGGVNALAASLGYNNPQYQAYYNMTRVLMPSLATEILRTGGANSTDTQKATAIAQANPMTWDSNPQMALQQWNYLKQVYQSIGQTVAQGPTAIRSGLRNSSDSQSTDMGNDPFGIL
jgi:hypothetical protein